MGVIDNRLVDPLLQAQVNVWPPFKDTPLCKMLGIYPCGLCGSYLAFFEIREAAIGLFSSALRL